MGDFVSVDGVDYFVTAVGKGNPLVLLHGFTGSSASWEKQIIAFSARFRVIAIDLLGHGRTDSPLNPDRCRMEQAAADIITILGRQKAEVRGQKTHLLGYSMGGRLALYLAVNYPDWFQSLILESASPGLETGTARAARQQQDNELADWIEINGIEAFVERWEKLPLWASQSQLPEETRLALQQQRLQNNATGLANSLRGMGTGVQPSLWPRLSEIKMPVLLLAGKLDSKFVAISQQMREEIPHAQLQIVPQTGHTIHLERPFLFSKGVLDFLTSPIPNT
ncbi:MAG: 2-succinyl-6-hydroxy-2,4-cyclohexadiene-1-carboxylate synthase [Ardenticatenaceae bacterium]|nr:2-succinyl-6-hydroxy-2,4-cyclohexadiene-1-carboxylate synthase [Ardenticatenaceae bacterium]MCB9444444.1 2-succinyl-6-hydroxy-2,4-cyclohexadiene-1-carboxylate synthase [Ardenticatenaceae bacterium]